MVIYKVTANPVELAAVFNGNKSISEYPAPLLSYPKITYELPALVLAGDPGFEYEAPTNKSIQPSPLKSPTLLTLPSLSFATAPPILTTI